MRFRGSFTPLTTAGGLLAWLWKAGVLLKDFKAFAEDFTRQIRQATEAGAIAAGRPVHGCRRPKRLARATHRRLKCAQESVKLTDN